MNTRYALRTVTTTDAKMYAHALVQYTMPSATEDIRKAKTWASARGAMQAAKRHNLTNVEAVAVLCAVDGLSRWVPVQEA